MKNLDTLRDEIDNIDKDLVALFQKRMLVVEQIRKYKEAHDIEVENKNREDKIIEKMNLLVENEELKPYVEKFLRSNMEISKQYQCSFKKL